MGQGNRIQRDHLYLIDKVDYSRSFALESIQDPYSSRQVPGCLFIYPCTKVHLFVESFLDNDRVKVTIAKFSEANKLIDQFEAIISSDELGAIIDQSIG